MSPEVALMRSPARALNRPLIPTFSRNRRLAGGVAAVLPRGACLGGLAHSDHLHRDSRLVQPVLSAARRIGPAPLDQVSVIRLLAETKSARALLVILTLLARRLGAYLSLTPRTMLICCWS